MKKLREVSFYDSFITNFHKNMYIKKVRRLSQWTKEIWPTSRRELGPVYRDTGSTPVTDSDFFFVPC